MFVTRVLGSVGQQRVIFSKMSNIWCSELLHTLQIRRAEEKEMIEKKRKEAEDKSYVTMMDEEQMQTNKDVAGKYESVEDMEDDFM